MKKILIANIFGIGDVLFTTPLIANLKEGLDDVSVDYLCNDRTKDIVLRDPDIDNILVYEKDYYTQVWNSSKAKCLKELYGLFRSIKSRKYDIVFDFTISREFGFLFALAGIKKRIGLNYKKRGIFLTDKYDLTAFENKHVVEYYMRLLDAVDVPAPINKMKLEPAEEDIKRAEKYLEGNGGIDNLVVGIVPGGGASWGGEASRKRWEPKGFARVADMLAEKNVKIALLGDKSEVDLCADIANMMTSRPLVTENDLSLREYMALLSKCDLVLCNDGGPLHMAVALGVKTVSIFGPVDAKVYGPYPPGNDHKVIVAKELECRPCYGRFKLPECKYDNRCLTDIDPNVVVDACMDLLNGGTA